MDPMESLLALNMGDLSRVGRLASGHCSAEVSDRPEWQQRLNRATLRGIAKDQGHQLGKLGPRRLRRLRNRGEALCKRC